MPDNKQPITKAVVRKQGFFSKMYTAFIKSDIQTVHARVVNDVIVPAVVNTIRDALNMGIDVIFDGPDARINRRRSTTSYSSYYKNKRAEVIEYNDNKKAVVIDKNRHFSSYDYLIHSRSDAEDVLADLITNIEDYGSATVGDFLDNIDVTPDPSAFTYGWKDLTAARVAAVSGGYILILPKPEPINK